MHTHTHTHTCYSNLQDVDCCMMRMMQMMQ